MELRSYLTFDALFPDDAVFDPAGDPIVPGGAAIAQFLRDRLALCGMRCSEQTQHKFYGWAFTVIGKRTSIWCLLQASDEWLLITERHSSLIQTILNPNRVDEHRDVLNMMLSAMRSDKRFSSIAEWTPQDYRLRG